MNHLSALPNGIFTIFFLKYALSNSMSETIAGILDVHDTFIFFDNENKNHSHYYF